MFNSQWLRVEADNRRREIEADFARHRRPAAGDEAGRRPVRQRRRSTSRGAGPLRLIRSTASV